MELDLGSVQLELVESQGIQSHQLSLRRHLHLEKSARQVQMNNVTSSHEAEKFEWDQSKLKMEEARG
jgi:hypothetical protein